MNDISVKMRGGLLRWQSQNLRKLLLPNVENISTETRNELESCFDAHDIKSIDRIVNNLTNSYS